MGEKFKFPLSVAAIGLMLTVLLACTADPTPTPVPEPTATAIPVVDTSTPVPEPTATPAPVVKAATVTPEPTDTPTPAVDTPTAEPEPTDTPTPVVNTPTAVPEPTVTITPETQTEEPLEFDPSVVRGTLSNGMAYYVRQNEEPLDRAQLSLVLKAGSVLEEENERGLAHFVEHMAFNGTERFEKQQIVDYLESIGSTFGADLNAYTSFDENRVLARDSDR